MTFTVWCTMHFKIIDDTFYKKLTNERFHMEIVRMESKADTCSKNYKVKVSKANTGEGNNELGTVLSYSLRMNYAETSEDFIKRTENSAEKFIPKYIKEHLNDIRRS